MKFGGGGWEIPINKPQLKIQELKKAAIFFLN